MHPLGLWNSPATRRLGGHVDVIIVGAGHCGLALSRVRGPLGISHAVLEGGEMANSRRTDRPDLLHVLMPNWMTRLPGFRYRGDDLDGCTSRLELADFFSTYADHTAVPVHSRIAAKRVAAEGDGHVAATDRGNGVATPSCSRPAPAARRACRARSRPCRPASAMRGRCSSARFAMSAHWPT